MRCSQADRSTRESAKNTWMAAVTDAAVSGVPRRSRHDHPLPLVQQVIGPQDLVDGVLGEGEEQVHDRERARPGDRRKPAADVGGAEGVTDAVGRWGIIGSPAEPSSADASP